VAKLAEAAEEKPASLSGWETDFLGEVGRRLEAYGSAFANLAKGRAEEALSNLQAVKLREIETKARKKPMRRTWSKKPKA
jgi:hypothetical protein